MNLTSELLYMYQARRVSFSAKTVSWTWQLNWWIKPWQYNLVHRPYHELLYTYYPRNINYYQDIVMNWCNMPEECHYFVARLCHLIDIWNLFWKNRLLANISCKLAATTSKHKLEVCCMIICIYCRWVVMPLSTIFQFYRLFVHFPFDLYK